MTLPSSRLVEEIQTIRNHVQMASGELDATVGYEICDMATSECSMKKFVGWTVVKPGAPSKTSWRYTNAVLGRFASAAGWSSFQAHEYRSFSGR